MSERGHTSKSKSAQLRVRFFDEANGLTPRYLVTGVCYRPKTPREDIPELYHTFQEYEVFKKEDMKWKLEIEIIVLQRIQRKESDDSLESFVDDNTERDRMKVELIELISRKYNMRIAV